MGFCCYELNTYMKLKLTPQRLSANINNSLLGGAAFAKKRADIYAANPSYCILCECELPQVKKNNKFCSRSCSAKHNNASRDYTTFKPGPAPKIKEKLIYSKLKNNKCKHCGIVWMGRTVKKYCQQHEMLYSHNGRAKYWFTFNVFQFPSLFDLTFIELHKFKSLTNPNGVTRDHKVSVNDAIRNNYDPYYIKHVLNCELMLFDENNKKNTKSSITYTELVNLVDAFDNTMPG